MPVSGMNQELLTKAEHLGMFITNSSPKWIPCTSGITASNPCSFHKID